MVNQLTDIVEIIQSEYKNNGNCSVKNEYSKETFSCNYKICLNYFNSKEYTKDIYEYITKNTKNNEWSVIPLIYISDVKIEDEILNKKSTTPIGQLTEETLAYLPMCYQYINDVIWNITNFRGPYAQQYMICVETDRDKEYTKLMRGYLQAPVDYKLINIDKNTKMFSYAPENSINNCQQSIYVIERNETNYKEKYHDLMADNTIKTEEIKVYKSMIDKLNKDKIDVSELYEQTAIKIQNKEKGVII